MPKEEPLPGRTDSICQCRAPNRRAYSLVIISVQALRPSLTICYARCAKDSYHHIIARATARVPVARRCSGIKISTASLARLTGCSSLLAALPRLWVKPYIYTCVYPATHLELLLNASVVGRVVQLYKEEQRLPFSLGLEPSLELSRSRRSPSGCKSQ
jgi:hypothetical protein